MNTRRTQWSIALLLISLPLVVIGRVAGQNASQRPSQSTEVQIEMDVPYAEIDGQTLLLDVYRPALTGQNRPAVILVHGGAWIGGSKSGLAWQGRGLAQAGYVAFSVDYRLLEQNGEQVTNRYPAQLDDVQRAVRWIRAHATEYGVNPNRLGALGDSAGGHLVALLGTTDTRDNSAQDLRTYSSRVNCVVDLYGPTDLATLVPTQKDFEADKLLTNLLGTTPQQGPEIYRAASPLFHIDRKTVPFLIFHGTEDKIVPVSQSQRFHKALRKARIESKLIIFKGEGHGFQKRNNIDTFNKETLAFFNRQLKS